MKTKTITSKVYTLEQGDILVNCDAVVNAIAVYLPAAVGGETCTVKKVDASANVVTVYPSGNDTLDGASSTTVDNTGNYKTFAAVKSGWVTVDAYDSTGDTLIAPTIIGGVHTTDKLNAVAATNVLAISGVAKDSETVTVKDDVYEFCADAAQTLTEGSTIAVNIVAGTTKSSNTLTIDTNPTATNPMTIGTTVYTFVATADFNAAGEIEIGTDVAVTQANIVAAIMGTDGVNEAHLLVTISDFEDDVATVTAKTGGTAGDAIATTETFTAGTNVFSGETLGGGADCLAPAAVTALVAAITASDTAGVGAADGAGDTVVLTADVPGAAGNAITTTETMANGAFAAATLTGGYDNALTTAKLINPTQAITINAHSYANGHTAWTLTSTELTKPVHKATLADGGADMVIPLTPSIPYTLINASGQTITVKGASGNGTAIANGKTATVMSDGTNVIRITPDA